MISNGNKICLLSFLARFFNHGWVTKVFFFWKGENFFFLEKNKRRFFFLLREKKVLIFFIHLLFVNPFNFVPFLPSWILLRKTEWVFFLRGCRPFPENRILNLHRGLLEWMLCFYWYLWLKFTFYSKSNSWRLVHYRVGPNISIGW